MFHKIIAYLKHQRQKLLTNKHVDPEQLAYVLGKFDGYDWGAFTPEGFVRWLQPQSIRPLSLRAIDIQEPGLFGAWLVTHDEPGDHFFYKTHLPRVHQVAVTLHEVGHWAWRHHTAKITTAQLETLTAGGVLNLDRLEGVRRRAGDAISHRADWEAEALALILFSRYVSARIVQPVDSGLRRVLREEV